MTDVDDPATRHRAPVLARLEAFTALGVVAVLALLLAAVTFTRPSLATEQRTVDYRQSVAFTYGASTDAESFYGADGLEPGETVVLDEIDELRVRIDYALDAGGDARLDGTARLTAVVAVTGGLRRTFQLGRTAVTGARADLEVPLPLDDMRNYLQRSRNLLGDAGAAATATVTLAPVVEVAGTLDGRAVQDTYAPTLDLVLNDDTLAVTTDGTDPVEADAEVLNPSEAGEATYDVTVPATLPLLVADPRVDLVRWVTLIVLLLCLVAMAVLGRRLFRRDDEVDEAAHILGLHGSRVVSVDRLELREGPVADVATFEDLNALARRYDTVIMHTASDSGHAFLVWDAGLTYRYRSIPGRPSPPRDPREDTPGPVVQDPAEPAERRRDRVTS